jgi:hypothetical protein
METVTLEQFIQGEESRLNRFKQYWLENNKINPEYFPLEININNAGVWDEQYSIFE